MSTEKIREAMSAMKSCIQSGEPWTQEMETALQLARGELEAIEKAADAWAEAEVGTAPKEVHDLMWSIRRKHL